LEALRERIQGNMNVHKNIDDEKLPHYVEERQKSRERTLTQI
jgi:hypothetical protein